jgi:hypothetical protein
MRLLLLASLFVVFLFSGGCGSTKPLTESEFKGFCYQAGDGRFSSCDTISVCDPYTVAMNMEQPSLSKCLEECEAVHVSQVWTYILTDCAGPNDSARDWCHRFCRTNYPK